jgi:serine O-acetyltransferase
MSITPEAADETVLDKIKADARVWAEVWHTPVGIRLWLRILLLEPGFQVALSLRAQEALTAVPLVGKLLRRIVWYMTTVWHGCDIGPSARIGGGILLPHPTGIVIGGDCIIGRRVHILQGVTLGISAATHEGGSQTTASPVIGDHVRIFAGAQVIGGVTIGRGAAIGANAVVLIDVPAGCSAVGVPARVLPRKAPQKVADAA